MQTRPSAASFAAAAFAAFAATVPAFAADYYVATSGSDDNDGSAATPFATIDKAISTATEATDVIHVAPGTYSTSAQYGPNLKSKLLGSGTSRDEVVIESTGTYRTLRTAAGSWVENVTIVGNTDITKVDKGGAIEMSGGTVTNCVIRDGTAKGNDSHNAGGNVYSSSTASLVVDCVISGGTAQRRGGNVCLDQGTLRNCTITGGATSGGSQQNNGGNVWTYQGKIENCTISGGSAEQGGNVYLYNANASVTGGSLADGTASQSGGNLYLRQGSISGAALSRGATTSNNNSQGGGNVYAEGNGGGATTISSCVLEDGTAKNRGGNAFLLAATIEDSTIIGGTVVDNASGIGGNFFMNNASALVSGCTITGGEVPARGGNVFLLAGTLQDSTVTGGICSNPTDQYWGGANIFIQGGKISRCIVRGGLITGGQNRGGGISVQGDPDKTIEDTLVCGNANGGIYCASSKVDIWNCTIVDNAEFGFYRYGGTPASFANCILFGNKRSSDNVLANFSGNLLTSALKLASEDSTRFGSLEDEFVQIDNTAFVDYADADYRPAQGGALVDAGAIDTRSGASATDLTGNPRQSGTIDIGCYEYQKPDMTVRISEHSRNSQFAPATVTFSHAVDNSASPETVEYEYNFGDGSTGKTTENTIIHTYATPGVYTVTITASSECEDEMPATMSYDGYLTVLSQEIHVSQGNASAAFPYNTPETGYATIQEAYADAVDGTVILVSPGTYAYAGQLDVTKAVTIRGTGNSPEDVVLRNTRETADSWRYRVMQVNNAAARVENLTMENGRVLNQYGGNLRVAAGVVSNCVIRGGTATANGGNAAGAGFVLGGQGGVVTHCVVSNNLVSGTSDNKNYAGGAVFVENGTKDGRLSNLLIAFNRYVSTDETKAGTAGVRYGGGNDRTALDSCTIVANTVEGTLPDDSAGVFCTSWHVPIRNCIVVGNHETGKGKSTSVKLDFNSGSGFSYLNNITDDARIEDSGNKSKDNLLVPSPAAIFMNYASGDFRLRSNGPARNAGTGTLPAGTPSVDLAGKQRVAFDKIDIGCFECQNLPATVFVIK